MKKKLLAFITAAMSVVFAFSLAACNGGNETTGGNGTHTHTYSEQWSHNDSEHWHTCTGADCDEVIDKAAHTWDNGNITKEPTCTAKGEMTYTCTVCKATKRKKLQQQTIPFLTNGKATTLTIGTSVSTATR